MIPLAYNYDNKQRNKNGLEFSILSIKKKSGENLSFSDIRVIVKMTMDGFARPKIARKINKSPQCVFNWQRKFFE